MASHSYKDFVLVGKTGQGKSTTGNKLLEPDNKLPRTEQQYSHRRRFTHGISRLLREASVAEKTIRFPQGDDLELASKWGCSITTQCELLANDETNVRVLDVPGFSESGDPKRAEPLTVYDANLQIFRWIVRVQIAMELHVKRLVYFLPGRGILRIADGTLQQELRLMHRFFGEAVFNNMVVVATQDPEYQAIDFGLKKIAATEQVFHSALMRAIGSETIGCPPVVYISTEDSRDVILDKLQTARVVKDGDLPLTFTDDVCAQCSVKIRSMEVRGERVGVVEYTNGEVDVYETSKCHPTFVQKYSIVQKIVGGVGHILTGGVPLAVEAAVGADVLWPGFTNSDEECPKCKRSPGSKGCCQVRKEIKADWMKGSRAMNVIPDHTNDI